MQGTADGRRNRDTHPLRFLRFLRSTPGQSTTRGFTTHPPKPRQAPAIRRQGHRTTVKEARANGARARMGTCAHACFSPSSDHASDARSANRTLYTALYTAPSPLQSRIYAPLRSLHSPPCPQLSYCVGTVAELPPSTDFKCLTFYFVTEPFSRLHNTPSVFFCHLFTAVPSPLFFFPVAAVAAGHTTQCTLAHHLTGYGAIGRHLQRRRDAPHHVHCAPLSRRIQCPLVDSRRRRVWGFVRWQLVPWPIPFQQQAPQPAANDLVPIAAV
ncbi:hypothetical protein PTNB73_07175 [Pyrenophora teres f. teres]|nr:hypothetical protein PTNB73_07175 [Pyrenophora teres f. teres]